MNISEKIYEQTAKRIKKQKQKIFVQAIDILFLYVKIKNRVFIK